MKLTNPYQAVADLSHPAKVCAWVAPELVQWNESLSQELGLKLNEAQKVALASGQGDFPSAALAYAGHQFGQFVPLLGDGRAHLLGAWQDANLRCWDIQLKGSGVTPFSRRGDGWCALGAAIREYVMSEALHGLGVATTRTLAVVKTGETIMRQSGPTDGALVTRVAASHIRIGSFQYLAARQEIVSLRALMELAITQHYPMIVAQGDERVLSFFQHVISAQIRLIVDWMRIGFIHGVMNTDNTLVSGDTIDYGPCAMMNQFDFQRVFSSIDSQGRYAYGQQPQIIQWNLARLAECLLVLMSAPQELARTQLVAVLDSFSEEFNQQFTQMWMNKLGLLASDGDQQVLIQSLLEHMRAHRLDYTNTFDALTLRLSGHGGVVHASLETWFKQWQLIVEDKFADKRVALMHQANPRVIPRNHFIETIIEQFEQTGQSALFSQLMQAMQTPYQLADADVALQDEPHFPDESYQTFCGT
ncbi:protein adenylyltransferase SelO [Celerinatantimonas yamalensis]|uniref:Protein nucleotidyltransferase YdiU n=1 Tax=Celerinatantimonas yamalensis TaxID=559956 RepID=A0ABW9GAG5_9GAMM